MKPKFAMASIRQTISPAKSINDYRNGVYLMEDEHSISQKKIIIILTPQNHIYARNRKESTNSSAIYYKARYFSYFILMEKLYYDHL